MQINSIPLPAQWTPQVMKQKYGNVGPREFDRGFRQMALSDDEKLFKSFMKCLKSGFRFSDVVDPSFPTYTGVDLASDKRPGTVIFTVAKDHKTGIRYPIDIRRGSWSSPETAHHLQDVDRKYNPQIIMIENNAYQAAQYQNLKHKRPNSRFTPIQTDKDKITRAWKLSALFEQERVFFRKGLQGPLIDPHGQGTALAP